MSQPRLQAAGIVGFPAQAEQYGASVVSGSAQPANKKKHWQGKGLVAFARAARAVFLFL